jgi:hypothetical protein
MSTPSYRGLAILNMIAFNTMHRQEYLRLYSILRQDAARQRSYYELLQHLVPHGQSRYDSEMCNDIDYQLLLQPSHLVGGINSAMLAA